MQILKIENNFRINVTLQFILDAYFVYMLLHSRIWSWRIFLSVYENKTTFSGFTLVALYCKNLVSSIVNIKRINQNRKLEQAQKPNIVLKKRNTASAKVIYARQLKYLKFIKITSKKQCKGITLCVMPLEISSRIFLKPISFPARGCLLVVTQCRETRLSLRVEEK